MIIECEQILNCAPVGRLLGIDFGRARVGLALSDTQWCIATPYKVLENKRFLQIVPEIAAIQAQEDIYAGVIGMPLQLDGKVGPQAQAVRQFAVNLAKKLDIRLCFWDERFSTAAVKQVLHEAGTSRQRRPDLVDKLSAAYILQGFLDRYKVGRVTS